MLQNQTRPADRRNPAAHERCHVIYSAQGQDYCREDVASCIDTYEKAVRYAPQRLYAIGDATARRVVDGFRVEWW